MQNATCLVSLTQGQSAIVDAADYDWAMQFSWHASKRLTTKGYQWCAMRTAYPKKCVMMHRAIAERAGLPWHPLYDHKDRNGLNNTRGNIRPSSRQQNMANSQKAANKSSQFKGVTWDKSKNKWSASIWVDYKRIHLGRFKDELEAAAIYAAYAIFFFGEFACFD